MEYPTGVNILQSVSQFIKEKQNNRNANISNAWERMPCLKDE